MCLVSVCRGRLAVAAVEDDARRDDLGGAGIAIFCFESAHERDWIIVPEKRRAQRIVHACVSPRAALAVLNAREEGAGRPLRLPEGGGAEEARGFGLVGIGVSDSLGVRMMMVIEMT